VSRRLLILFVPGLRPKPEPALHRRALLTCLLEGVRRIDESIAAEMRADDELLQLVEWNYAFYESHHDIRDDLLGIDAMLEKPEASAEDIAEVESWRRRLLCGMYRIADRLPFLIPRLADEKLALQLRDLRRYVGNHDAIAEYTRQLLITPLQEAYRQSRPILLIGHSMGSVIAYDALWELSHVRETPFQLDTFLTLGSPLGQNYLQRRLLGHDRRGAARYPANIGEWINIAAVGELTALDLDLKNDFREMRQLGLVRSIDDCAAYNWFRADGGSGDLNVHSEYGYLVNAVTAGIVARCWADSAA
jgi:hypothetical protein